MKIMENALSGGYTSFRPIESDEKDLFEHILQQITGVKHTPLAVSTQVVNGTNYAFLCESKVVRPNVTGYNTLVIIHKPLPNVNEAPTLLEIKTIKII